MHALCGYDWEEEDGEVWGDNFVNEKFESPINVAHHGVVHANVGQNVSLLTFPLRLFFTIFLRNTSS